MGNQQASNHSDFELIQKLVSVRRTSKTLKGGRDFAFSALVVVGDGKGKVGFALGKAKEVPIAITKAYKAAQKAWLK